MAAESERVEDDEFYEMVNLVPRLTGLPMTVWARPREFTIDADEFLARLQLLPP